MRGGILRCPWLGGDLLGDKGGSEQDAAGAASLALAVDAAAWGADAGGAVGDGAITADGLAAAAVVNHPPFAFADIAVPYGHVEEGEGAYHHAGLIAIRGGRAFLARDADLIGFGGAAGHVSYHPATWA